MRRFVMGDVHGAHKAMVQCFERSGFNYDADELIVLGDVVDGWPDVKECFDELFRVKNLIFVVGNHDLWALDWMRKGATPKLWTDQGGKATIESLKEINQNPYLNFLSRAYKYYEDDEGRLFVHGGIKPGVPIKEQSLEYLVWDRTLFETALHRYAYGDVSFRVTGYQEVFIGHSTTSVVDWKMKPVNIGNLWCLDQGAGYEGKLTMMNIETKEFWQSGEVDTLYDCHNVRKI